MAVVSSESGSLHPQPSCRTSRYGRSLEAIRQRLLEGAGRTWGDPGRVPGRSGRLPILRRPGPWDGTGPVSVRRIPGSAHGRCLAVLDLRQAATRTDPNVRSRKPGVRQRAGWTRRSRASRQEHPGTAGPRGPSWPSGSAARHPRLQVSGCQTSGLTRWRNLPIEACPRFDGRWTDVERESSWPGWVVAVRRCTRGDRGGGERRPGDGGRGRRPQ